MAHKRIGKIASGVAILFQLTQGTTLGMVVGTIAQQSMDGDSGLDPALLAAYGAIGALFSLYVWSTKGRTERCEKQQDTMLTSDAERNITMRDLANATIKNADVTASLVASHNSQVEEIRRLGQVVTNLQIALGAKTAEQKAS